MKKFIMILVSTIICVPLVIRKIQAAEENQMVQYIADGDYAKVEAVSTATAACSKDKLDQTAYLFLCVLDRLFPEITFASTTARQTAIMLQPYVEKFLNMEIKLAVADGNTKFARLYYKLAKYYAAAKLDYQQALKYAKKALELDDALSSSDLANALNVTGVIYRKLGDTQEGLAYLKKGLEIRQLLYSGDHPDLADSFHTIGTAYNQHGATQEGLRYAQMGLEMYQRLGNHYEIGCSLNAVGMGYLDLGDFEKSCISD